MRAIRVVIRSCRRRHSHRILLLRRRLRWPGLRSLLCGLLLHLLLLLPALRRLALFLLGRRLLPLRRPELRLPLGFLLLHLLLLLSALRHWRLALLRWRLLPLWRPELRLSLRLLLLHLLLAPLRHWRLSRLSRPRLHRLLWRRVRRTERALLLGRIIEGRTRRRRSLLGDDLPLHHGGRRARRRHRGGTHHALLHWGHREVALHLDFAHLLLIHPDIGGGHGTRVDERVVRDDGHRLDILLVHVGHIIHIYIIVYIRYVDHVHRGIRDVHSLHVAFAGAVWRNVHFARSQREPAHAATSAERQGSAEARPADKHHQRRRIHRPDNHWPRNPAPPAADFRPAAVVKRSKSPGLIFHPGPSPRSNPRPVAIAIRRPTGGDARWKPNFPVIGDVAPFAVVIEVFVSDDVARNVTGRLRALFALVTRAAPFVKIVHASGAIAVVGQGVRAGKVGAIAGIHVVFIAGAGGFAFTRAHGDRGGIPVGVDIDAIFTGALQREGQVGRIDFEIIAAFHPPHSDAHRTLRQLDLHGAVVEIQESDAGLTGDANGRTSNVQLAAGIAIGPEIVAGGQRAVGIGLDPIAFAAGLEGNRALDVVQARHPSGRIIIRQGRQ